MRSSARSTSSDSWPTTRWTGPRRPAVTAERRGGAGAAQQHLQEAIAIFQECGAGGYLQKAKTEWIRLASLSMEA